MTYDTDGFGGLAGHGGRLHDERHSRRDDVEEEEPSELDAPASDGLDDDLEDDEQEALSPLAEDQPADDSEDEAYVVAEARAADDDEEEEGDLDEQPGVRLSGGGQGPNMTESERRREFPTAREVAKAAAAKRSSEPRVTKRRGRKKTARA
jgi:hypothetical protein